MRGGAPGGLQGGGAPGFHPGGGGGYDGAPSAAFDPSDFPVLGRGAGQVLLFYFILFYFYLAAFDPPYFPVLGRDGGQVLTVDVESVCVCAKERVGERKCE